MGLNATMSLAAVTVLTALAACSAPSPGPLDTTSASGLPSSPETTPIRVSDKATPSAAVDAAAWDPEADACDEGVAYVAQFPGSPPLSAGRNQEGNLICVYGRPEGGPSASIFGYYSTASEPTSPDPSSSCGFPDQPQATSPLSDTWLESRGWSAVNVPQPDTEGASVFVILCTNKGGYTTMLRNIPGASPQDALGLLKSVIGQP